MTHSFDILDGGLIRYTDAFYPIDMANGFLSQIRSETPWRQERSRFGPFPRLTAWYADAGLTYRYSGVTHEALPWTEMLARIREDVQRETGITFNSLLLNLYRDGNDSIGYHADDEPELGTNPSIASISLGGVRQFVLKHRATGEKLRFDLAHGSLLFMGGTCQNHWVHAVPKSKLAVPERINLTFRQITRT